MSRVVPIRRFALGLCAAAFLGPAVARVDAQHGGGGGHAGGGGGMHMGGGIKAGGYGYHPGYRNYGYGLGFGYYPYYGGYGYYPYGGYGFGYGNYGYGYGLGTMSLAAGNAYANPTGASLGTMSLAQGESYINPTGPGLSAFPAYPYNYGGYVGNYSPTAFAYGSPVGGYGAYGGYGGFGGYGGLGIYGGLGATIGLSPYDQFALKDQLYAGNASRYNLQNAEAVQAYSAANYYNIMANAAANSMTAPASNVAIKPLYNVQNGSQTAPNAPNNNEGGASPHRNHVPDLARDVIMDPDGNLRWPAPAPNDGDLAGERKAVDDAILKAVADAKAAGGRAPIRDVVDARDKLYAYGNRAMQQVHTNDQPNASGVARFLNSVDHALLAMGEGPSAVSHANPAVNPAAANVNKLENAPKSAGDVLRDTIQDEKKANIPPPPAPTPDSTPKAP